MMQPSLSETDVEQHSLVVVECTPPACPAEAILWESSGQAGERHPRRCYPWGKH